MKTPHEKYSGSLIVSRLQQIEIASLKPSLTVDSPFFHLLTVTDQKPFFDNLPLHVGMEFRLIGSKILGMNITRGYFCHDLEETLSTLRPKDAFIAIARLNLSSPIFYQAALYSAYTRLANRAFQPEHLAFFTVAMEFSRIAHQLLVIKNVLHCLKLHTLAEIVIDCEEILRPPCRIMNRCRSPEDPLVSALATSELNDIITDAYARAEELAFAISLEPKIRAALQRKAVISMTQAGSMGLTGSYLRANQELYDLRRQSLYGLPYEKPPRISIGEGGDAWTRFSLRPMDMLASLKWIKHRLLQTESAITELKPLVIDDDFCTFDAKNELAFGEIESAEGDLKISIFMAPNGTPLFRIRTPAYFIAQAIPQMLSHLDLADVAVLLFSMGISAEEIDT